MIKETLLFGCLYETIDGGQSCHSTPVHHTLLSPARCIETPLLPSHHRLPAHALLSLGVLSLLAALLRGFFWCYRSLLKCPNLREVFFDSLELDWWPTVNLCHHALMVCFTTHDLSLFIVRLVYYLYFAGDESPVSRHHSGLVHCCILNTAHSS